MINFSPQTSVLYQWRLLLYKLEVSLAWIPFVVLVLNSTSWILHPLTHLLLQEGSVNVNDKHHRELLDVHLLFGNYRCRRINALSVIYNMNFRQCNKIVVTFWVSPNTSVCHYLQCIFIHDLTLLHSWFQIDSTKSTFLQVKFSSLPIFKL